MGIRQEEGEMVVQALPAEIETSSKDDLNQLRAAAHLQGWRLTMINFCLLLSLVLAAMDSSIVATALVTIGSYFDDFESLQWIVLSYLLTYLSFTLVISRFSDVIGRKWTFLGSVFILTLSSLACGFANTLNQLIAFRAIQGFGSSGIFSMVMTVAPEITPAEKFPALSGLVGLTFAVSSVLGPILGGIISTHSTWRWCFWFNVPIGAVVMAIALASWPRSRSTAGKISWRRMDVVGCVLFVAWSLLLVFALQEGGAGAYDWASGVIIACFVVAAITFVAFWGWTWRLSVKERYFAPLFHWRILLQRTLAMNILALFFVGYVFFTILIELPQRFEIVNGKTPQAAGIAILPLLGASAVGSTIGGLSSAKRNNTFLVSSVGLMFIVLGCGLLSSVAISNEVPMSIYGYQVFFGLGCGILFATSTVVIKLNAGLHDTASAQGLLGQSRILGGDIGLAVSTIVTNTHFKNDLQGMLSDAQIEQLRKSLNALKRFDQQQVEAVALSFARSFRTQLQICVVVAAAGLVAALLSWQRHPPHFADWAEESKRSETRDGDQTAVEETKV